MENNKVLQLLTSKQEAPIFKITSNLNVGFGRTEEEAELALRAGGGLPNSPTPHPYDKKLFVESQRFVQDSPSEPEYVLWECQEIHSGISGISPSALEARLIIGLKKILK